MIPLALTFAILALQVGGVLWAITSVNDAVRQGARADSLDRNGCAAARDAVPDTLTVLSCTPRAPSGVTLQVTVPVISDYLPPVTITRTAVMP